jgi:CRISPR-associated protein Cst2
MSKHLTLSILFQGRNLNYGDTVGIIGSLKKHHRDGRVYTYLSRQAIRYNLIELLASWDEKWKTDVELKGKSEAKTSEVSAENPKSESEGSGMTLQYAHSAHIKDNPELDLFGYMKTVKAKKGKGGAKKGANGDESKEEDAKETTSLRTAPVRISDATSIEPWNPEIAFNNNMGLLRRKQRNSNSNDSAGLIPFQYETHFSWYTYTITVDLDRIGKLDGESDAVDNIEKARRINVLLDGVKTLYRDIRGRREDLSPQFVIGGVTGTGNPLFYNLLKVEYKNGSDALTLDPIEDKLQFTIPPENEPIKDLFHTGVVDKIFANDKDIRDKLPNVTGVEEFFEKIKKAVSSYYGAKG